MVEKIIMYLNYRGQSEWSTFFELSKISEAIKKKMHVSIKNFYFVKINKTLIMKHDFSYK